MRLSLASDGSSTASLRRGPDARTSGFDAGRMWPYASRRVTAFTYRAAAEADATRVSLLVKQALGPTTLPGWTPDAISKLLAKATPEALAVEIRNAAFSYVCADGELLAGFILCKELRFLNLLVVAPSRQREGVGSRLVACQLEHLAAVAPDLSIVEVNATRHSLPFYRRLGFYPLSEFVDFEGCRFARMGYWRRNPLLVCKSTAPPP